MGSLIKLCRASRPASPARSAWGLKVLSAAFVLALCLGGVATAQEIPPPKVIATDDNGVDLLSGNVAITETANSIGPGGPGSFVASETTRVYDQPISSLNSYVQLTRVGNQGYTALVLDGRSQSFKGTAGTGGTQVQGDSVGRFDTGADASTGIVYTAPDGRKAVFEYVLLTTNAVIATGYIKTLTFPSGEVLTFTRASGNLKVESSLGYVTFGSQEGLNAFTSNLTTGNCDASDCGGQKYLSQASLGRATQSVSTGGTNLGPITVTYTNPTGVGARAYTLQNLPYVPGEVSYRVTSYTKGGAAWTYAHSFAQDSNFPDAVDGIVTVTVNDPNGVQRIVKSRLSNGHVISDQEGVTSQNPLGLKTTYQYLLDPTSTTGLGYGKLSKVIMPGGDAFEYVFDQYNNITSLKHYPRANGMMGLSPTQVTAGYSCHTSLTTTTCNQPDWIKDENGQQTGATTNFTYDTTQGHGLVTVVQKPAVGGVRPETRYTYQQYTPRFYHGGVDYLAPPVWRLKQTSSCRTTPAPCIGAADETVVVYDYEPSSSLSNVRLTSVTTRSGDPSQLGQPATTTYAYNPRGDVIETDGPLAGNVDLVQSRYDASRWKVGEVGPDPDGADTTLRYRASKTVYRADGQVQAVGVGRVADRLDATFANSFQALSSVTNEYDTQARLAVQTSTGTGAAYAQTQYSYDAFGRQDCVAVRMNPSQFASHPVGACTLGAQGTDGPDRITRTAYDELGRVKTVTSGLGVDPIIERSTTYTPNGAVQTLIGGVATLPAGEGGKTLYQYDDLERLKWVFYPWADKTLTTQNISDYEVYDYDPHGNVVSQRRRDGLTITSQYDALNRLWTRTVPATADAPTALSYTYLYDNFDHLISASEGGRTVTSVYDSLGRLKSETGPVGAVAYTYDAASRRTAMTWPGAAFYVTYEYDNSGALKVIRRLGSSVIAQFDYDDLGRRTSLTRGNTVATAYAYDTDQRLSSLTHTAPSSPADSVSFNFFYNAAGQIERRTISNSAYVYNGAYAVDRGYTANGLNQMTAAGATGLGYDVRGNLKTDGTMTYLYDLENRLRGVASGPTLTYDPLGRLFRTTNAASTATRYVYDGPNIIGEYSDANAALRYYVAGDGTDEPLARYAADTTTADWLLADQQGSIIAATNAAGAVTAKETYDDYGAPASTANVGLFRYTGQVWLADLSVYHYKARAYSPTWGRFLQTDPIGYGDGLNWYAYVGNDPLNGSDSTGTADDDNTVSEVALSFVRGNCNRNCLEGIVGRASDSLQQAATDYFTPSNGPGCGAAVVGGAAIGGSAGAVGGAVVGGVGGAVAGGGVLSLGTGAAGAAGGANLGGQLGTGLGAVGGWLTAPSCHSSTASGDGSGGGRVTNPGKQNSSVWQRLKNYRNGIKTDGKNYYTWDHTHNDIEVFNGRGQHLGSMNPSSGQMYKPAVGGRVLGGL